MDYSWDCVEEHRAMKEREKDAESEADMQNLNLFGVPIAEIKEEGENKETKKILRELLALTDEVAGMDFTNFNNRKSFAYYDVSYSMHNEYSLITQQRT